MKIILKNIQKILKIFLFFQMKIENIFQKEMEFYQ